MIEILWQCHACVVVNKPVGLPTTSPKGTDSLESCLREQFAQAGNPVSYLTAVHRLDRPVSGLVLIALRKKAARLLSEQFRLRHVQKKYIAMVQGNALEACKQEPWHDTIAKLTDEARVEIVGPDSTDGRQAETKVSFLEYDSESDTSRIELRPVTGRMHQLRIQSAHRGHPIVGDPLYGTAEDESTLRLVAAKLSFRDPTNGRAVEVELPELPF
ncbi:RluA family pseudouridine synthase [Rhodopirellula baltica]|uniref:Dual specificity pseudouridine synthase for 23S rRNA and tRNAphe modification (RluA-like) protein n=1 Tax=Rhodopirellula baltica WH47 TaxID=991778 RepID=F2APJ8_RHOBT|nr:RNA pseudouridine synthase [Rhodopirellula baltica]EGF28421.1 dual specificity pseudouridine synthase for 23S rRNA and tRNAphe modification (RluA-like) protein [Rhodopirellula baltica WH47]